MLTRLVVENFKSFDSKAELTMVSSSKIRTKLEHRVKIGSSTRLLKHAVIYGANASGKSNFIDFFRFFKTTVEKGLPVWGMKYFCRSNKKNENRDSTFEIHMEINGKFYAYGFSARLSERRITGEWLYELYQNGSAKRIFERENNSKPILDSSINLSSEEGKRFETYATDFEDNTANLFLGEMNRGKKIAKESNLQVFRTVYMWIMSHIVIITPSSVVTDWSYYYENDSLAQINSLVSTFDTGISNVRIENIDMGELSKMLPKPILDDVLDEMRKRKIEAENQTIRMSGRSDTNFFNIEWKGSEEPKITTIKLRHEKSIYDFDFEDESDGTRRLFDLLDMLLTNRDDVVYVVDELERSLHPKLTERFMELFASLHKNHKIQLIFSTHEAAIMNQKLFRRDEIWFIEKDEHNSSKIYSLDQFKERYDKILSKAYLDGRYGAIPIFKKFSFREEN
ncbi:MAG: ATP-binding protein [Clostridiales bacterium]|nr:ATP-binding protein [Clostridiales bacterium]